ncbi:MAG TPA: hypothetical protein VGD98_05465 [Ktedonobacteraceae bacterium]
MGDNPFVVLPFSDVARRFVMIFTKLEIHHQWSDPIPVTTTLLAFYLFDPQTGWSLPVPITANGGKPIVVGQDNSPCGPPEELVK